MALKLIETSVDHIPTALRSHYVKEANGSYRLSVSDLETHLRPLKIAIAASKLENALTRADVLPGHADMLLRRLGDRVVVDLIDGEAVVRIRPSTSGALVEADRATTLEELVGATSREFPFLFSRDNAQAPSVIEATGNTITRSEFDALSPQDKRKKVIDEKVRVTDDPEAPARQPRLGAKEMARSDFDALSASDRSQRMADGWTLFD